jgi:hypothetical protein
MFDLDLLPWCVCINFLIYATEPFILIFFRIQKSHDLITIEQQSQYTPTKMDFSRCFSYFHSFFFPFHLPISLSIFFPSFFSCIVNIFLSENEKICIHKWKRSELLQMVYFVPLDYGDTRRV